MTTAIKFMTTAELSKAIDSIKNRGAKLDKAIHEAALSCLNNANEHNNPTMANALLAAMPKSGRKLALLSWFLAFGKLIVNPDAASKKAGVTVVYNRDAVGVDPELVEAQAKPFYDFTKEAEPKPWSYDDFAGSVLKTLQNQATKRGTDGELTAEALKASATFALLSKVTA